MDDDDLYRLRARSFGAVADVYERARPTYPSESVAWLLEQAAGRRAIDLGAGTGKLTRLLLEQGLRVTAVEPLEEMRAELCRAVPEATALAGSAEAIPAAAGSADVVTAAQAFHWFDHPRALAEIARVLVPSGVVGLLWNLRDDREPWVAELSRILDAGDTTTRFGEEDWAPLAADPRFTPPELREFAHVQTLDPLGLLEWARSTSRLSTLEPAERTAVLAAIADLCRTHPDLRDRDRFALPYVTHAVRAHRR